MPSSRHDSRHSGRKVSEHPHSASSRSPHRPTTPHKPGTTANGGGDNALYVEDRRGDRQNLAYGALDRYAVPRYRASGGGVLLGLDRRYRIISRSETRCEIENVEIDSSRRTRKQSLLSTVVSEDPAPLKPKQSSESDLQKDFLELDDGHSRKRRRITDRPGPQLSDTDGESSVSSESDAEDLDHDAFEAFKKDPVHQRHVELSRATVENPQDPEVWLAFIDYQQTYFSHESGLRISSTSGRSLIDLKISLYEQALSHVKDAKGRQTLMLGMIQEASKIWDAEKQASQWRKFLHKDSSFELWVLYLNFVQSNQVRFTFESCLDLYRTCLKNFQSYEQGRWRDMCCVYLVLRCTLLFWQCGLTEEAIGIWQALLEYNFFRPEKPTSEELIESFQQFWESEVARIGDEGATGWNSMSSADLEANADRKVFEIPSGDIAAWANAENDLDRCAAMPARSLDDVDEADPYRVLLFSDIKDFLFATDTPEGSWLLQDAFLLFVGLPPLSDLPEPRQWRGDPFIYTQLHAAANWSLSVMSKQDTFNLADVLCETGPSLPMNALSTSRTVTRYCLHFVRRCLLQLAIVAYGGGTDESLPVFAISLESRIDPKAARKQAKAILKRIDNLSLYNAYAILEFEAGNFDSAERVWLTAISMSESLGSSAEGRTFLLWRDWVCSYMYRKQFARANLLLSMLTDRRVDLLRLLHNDMTTSTASAAKHIKTEHHLKAQLEWNISRRRAELLPILIDLLAVHRYLTQNQRLDSALDIYETYLKVLGERWTSQDPVVEAVHERRAQIMHAHATVFSLPYKPKTFRHILTDSAQAFPYNLRLLMLQHHYAQQSGLFDRLREVDPHPRGLRQADRGDSSVVPSLFDLLKELTRPSYAGSTDHSIRSAFKRATDQEAAGCHSLAIWKAYLLWELSVASRGGRPTETTKLSSDSKKQNGPQTLTEVFYASLRACPWAKELYMLAFTEETLRNTLGLESLKQICGSMQDRGLRLHIDLSEYLK